MAGTSCSKCGSTEVLPEIPVLSSIDKVTGAEIPAFVLTYDKPDAWVFKGPVIHRFLARICGACGFAEFYVEDPKGLLDIIKRTAEGD